MCAAWIAGGLHYLRDMALGPGEWISSYKGIQEGAWFSADDWRPFLQVGSQFLWKPVRRLIPRFRRASPVARAPQAIGMGKC